MTHDIIAIAGLLIILAITYDKSLIASSIPAGIFWGIMQVLKITEVSTRIGFWAYPITCLFYIIIAFAVGALLKHFPIRGLYIIIYLIVFNILSVLAYNYLISKILIGIYY